jgi:hypothetical protein
MKCLRWILAVAVCAGGACSDDNTTDDGSSIMPAADGGTGEVADAGGDEADAADTTPDAVPMKSCDGVTMQLGTGNREYIPTDDGDLIYLFKGPQGGYMVYLGVRARGINRDDAMLCYTEYVVDTDREVGKKCWNIKLTNDLGDGLYERVGVWGELYSKYWTFPSAVRGHMLRVTATISDDSGCSAEDGWTVNVSPDAPM